MNKELFRTSINKKLEQINYDDDLLELTFDGEVLKLEGYHEQDCCENVYADLSVVKYYKKNIIDKEIKEIIIKGVDDMGFLICFYFDYDRSEKVFIPCYNSQNGYYSSNLDLIITRGDIVSKIDISDFVEDT